MKTLNHQIETKLDNVRVYLYNIICMNLQKEIKYILLGLGIFLFLYFLPQAERIFSGVKEGTLLLNWYVKEHTVFCLIPAFYIAGAIGTFLSKESILKYLGPEAPKLYSFLIASISGIILAICSCTILPLFAGLYLRGAGIGPATTFLYSGPAINVLAIVLTTKVFGIKISFFRTLGAIFLSLIIGILMHLIFKKSEKTRLTEIITTSYIQGPSLKISATLLATLIGILILATWSGKEGSAEIIYQYKWILVSFLAFFLTLELSIFFKIKIWYLILLGILVSLFQILLQIKEFSFLLGTLGISYLAYQKGDITREWVENSYILARQILPFLFLGVFISGFLFGFNSEGFIPSIYIKTVLGGTDFLTHLLASFFSALMYFATITEVPIIQGLTNAGMSWGPALAMLLAGPAISLPSLLGLKNILGGLKTLTFLILIILFSAIYGYFYENFLN